MKILSLFTSLLILTTSSIVSAESFVKDDTIVQKVFHNVFAVDDDDCSVETRDFENGNETRIFSTSDESYCHEFLMDITLTESTYTANGFTFSDYVYSYNPGIPFIIENMDVATKWDSTSDFLLNGDAQSSRTDYFEVISRTAISTPAGDFENCLVVNWKIIGENIVEGYEANIWYCEYIGIVQQERIDNDHRIVLQSITYYDEINDDDLGDEQDNDQDDGLNDEQDNDQDDGLNDEQDNDQDDDLNDEQDSDQDDGLNDEQDVEQDVEQDGDQSDEPDGQQDTEVDIGEEAVAFGANYIQPNSITSKQFQDVNSSTGECDIENRFFSGNIEYRTYSSTDNQTVCDTDLTFHKEITSSSLTYTANELVSEGENYLLEYKPGIPVIIETMTVGESWSQISDLFLNGDQTNNSRSDFFRLDAIEGINTPAGNFNECLKIYWESYSSVEIYLWFCPQVGLAKYNHINKNQSWVLQNLSSEEGEEQTTVSGADYIQSSTINYKKFQNIHSGDEECDIRESTFFGQAETRTFSNSVGSEEVGCSEYYIHFEITDSSHTEISSEYEDENGTHITDYSPGIPFIINEMTLGKSWEQTSLIKIDGENSGSRTDTMALLSIEDIDVAAGSFKQCIKVRWKLSSYFDLDLWYCPNNVGVVKYQFVGEFFNENSWELQEYTPVTNENTDGAGNSDGGGSGGGGNIPFALLTTLGFFTLRRKNK